MNRGKGGWAVVFALQFEALSEYLPAFFRTDRIGEHPTGDPLRLWGPPLSHRALERFREHRSAGWAGARPLLARFSSERDQSGCARAPLSSVCCDSFRSGRCESLGVFTTPELGSFPRGAGDGRARSPIVRLAVLEPSFGSMSQTSLVDRERASAIADLDSDGGGLPRPHGRQSLGWILRSTVLRRR